MATSLERWLKSAGGWTCPVCETRHEGATKNFLICAGCRTPKGEQRPSPLVDGSDRQHGAAFPPFDELGNGPLDDAAPEVVLCGNQPLSSVVRLIGSLESLESLRECFANVHRVGAFAGAMWNRVGRLNFDFYIG